MKTYICFRLKKKNLTTQVIKENEPIPQEAFYPRKVKATCKSEAMKLYLK